MLRLCMSSVCNVFGRKTSNIKRRCPSFGSHLQHSIRYFGDQWSNNQLPLSRIATYFKFKLCVWKWSNMKTNINCGSVVSWGLRYLHYQHNITWKTLPNALDPESWVLLASCVLQFHQQFKDQLCWVWYGRGDFICYEEIWFEFDRHCLVRFVQSP